MLKFFKRLAGAKPGPAARTARAQPEDSRGAFAPTMPSGLAPLTEPPLPEVVAEGNEHSDWSLWEDSVAALDSQLGPLAPSKRIRVRDTRPSQLDELDAFSGIRKNRDV